MEVILYRANLSRKKIFIWKIRLEIRSRETHEPSSLPEDKLEEKDLDVNFYAVLIMQSGTLNGKLKGSELEVDSGKNRDKKNWTNVWTQGILELQSRVDSKLKEGGYYKELIEAQTSISSSSSLPGLDKPITPMAALLYDDYKDVVVTESYVYVQPKLDGQRIMTFINSKTGELVMYTRGQEMVLNYPEIKENAIVILTELAEYFSPHVHLDGEFYLHGHKLNEYVALSRKEKMTEADSKIASQVTYNVFDIFIPDDPEISFEKRYVANARDIIDGLGLKRIKSVPTHIAETQEDVNKYFQRYLKKGFEGVMVRTPKDPYPRNSGQNRVKYLLKLKPWFDIDCEILDVKEGKGLKKGTPIWKVRPAPYETGKFKGLVVTRPFWVTPGGTTEERKKMFEASKEWLGRIIRVKFQEVSTEGTPQRPTTDMTLVVPSKF